MAKCKFCKERFTPKTSLDKFCSIQCGLDYLQTDEGKAKTQKAKRRIQTKRKQEQKQKDDVRRRASLGWQHSHTQKAFNKMRRLEELLWYYESGLEPECISCGKTSMDWCCGHYKTVGSSSGLRYNRVNTFLQCNWSCNRNLSGNINGNAHSRGFTQGIHDRFGPYVGPAIIEYLETNQHKKAKWTWQELEEMRADFNARIRQLDKQLSRYIGETA